MLWPMAAAFACAGASAAPAQEWKLSTNISQRLLYSDNLLLNRRNEVDTFGSITTPGLLLERTSPTSHVALGGRFQFEGYFDHSEFDSQDQILDLDVEQQLSERSTLGLDANFTRDTTLTSDQDITNRFLDDAIRFISWRVAPSWNYRLTPIDEVGLRASYREVTYDSAEKTDYQHFGPTAEYSRQLSELTRFTASLSATRFVPDEPGDNRTDTVGTLLGYGYTPSERFSISGAAGLAYAMQQEDGAKDDSDLGYRIRFNMRYMLSDQASARVSLSHDTEPSGDGDQVTRNRASVAFDYRLTELTSVGFDLNYADNVDFLGFEGSSTDGEDDRSRYVSLRPNVAWHLTEDLSLVASYQYRHKVFEDDNDSATSNSVFLTLEYDLPTLAGTGF
jgi:hypothetical protein